MYKNWYYCLSILSSVSMSEHTCLCVCSSTTLYTENRKRLTPFRRETSTSGSWPAVQSTWPQCSKWVTEYVLSSWIQYNLLSLVLISVCLVFPPFPFRNLWQLETHVQESQWCHMVIKLHWVPVSGSDWMKDMKQSPRTRWRICWGTSAHAAMLSCTALLLGQIYGGNQRLYACMVHSQAYRHWFPKTVAWRRMEQRLKRASHPSELLLKNTAP